MSARARRVPLDRLRAAILAALLAWLGLVLVGPLLGLAFEVGRAPLEVAAAMVAADALDAIGKTVLITLITVGISLIVGLVGGWVMARHTFPGKRLVDAMIDLPLAVSPVMIGLAFLLLVGRGGLLAPGLDALGWKIAFAFPGLVIATLFVTLPFTVREVTLVLEELGTSEEEAAATLGATPWQAFRWVTLPSLRDALTTGTLLTTARSLGEFGAVLVLGGAISMRTSTATTFVHLALEERNPAGAYGVSLLLAAATVALVALLDRERR